MVRFLKRGRNRPGPKTLAAVEREFGVSVDDQQRAVEAGEYPALLERLTEQL